MRQLAGWGIVVVGVVVAAVGAFAQPLGLSQGDNTEFGTKQLLMVVAGIVVAAVGLVVALVLKGKEPAA